jgi:hypothetical protein
MKATTTNPHRTRTHPGEEEDETAQLLPQYHSRPAPRRKTPSRPRPRPRPWKYLLYGFALGLLLLGAQLGWVHRAEVARALRAAVKRAGVHAWALLRGIVIMLGRAVAWAAKSVCGVVKGGWGMLWRWVSGGGRAEGILGY